MSERATINIWPSTIIVRKEYLHLSVFPTPIKDTLNKVYSNFNIAVNQEYNVGFLAGCDQQNSNQSSLTAPCPGRLYHHGISWNHLAAMNHRSDHWICRFRVRATTSTVHGIPLSFRFLSPCFHPVAGISSSDPDHTKRAQCGFDLLCFSQMLVSIRHGVVRIK